ncbi:hypothetical protein AB4Y64_04405 [Lysobacter sp. TAF61]|uniref:hypothetical protein n=1 Tax=Lysobacter sp. TAF61 TaxID=3233072 RepID=UPI003F9C2323
MPTLYYLMVALFAAGIANDWFLARKIRNAVEAGRLKGQDFEGFRFGGSPLGIVINLFRLRKMPVANDLSDPDHIAIRRHCRTQEVLVASLAACIAAGFFRNIAA